MPDKQDHSIGELLSQLGTETATLVRQEVALAKVELSGKVSRIGKDVGRLAVGGAIAYAALLAFLAALIILLANIVPLWAAAITVAVVVGITGFVMISNAMAALKQTDLTPRQTVQTLKEDAQWAKQQVK